MELFRRTRGRMLLLGLVALVVAAFAVPALAQSASEDAPSEATSDDGSGGPFAEARTAFAEALAEELDLPVDRVTDALTAVRERLMQERQEQHRSAVEERLDEAVEAGELTREQADAILDAAEVGVLGGGRGPGMRGFGHHGPRGWFDGDGVPSMEAPEDAAAGDRA